MAQKYYWKVVAKRSGGYESARQTHTKYGVGEITVASVNALKNGYGLCIFKTREAARRFKDSSEFLFKCKVGNVFNPPANGCHGHGDVLKMIETGVAPRPSLGSTWPAATLMTDALILIERSR